MVTYIWVTPGGDPLRRRPRHGELAMKRCGGCSAANHASRRTCYDCRESMTLRKARRRKPDLDAQLKAADLHVAEWHRKARIALGRITKWTYVRNRLMRKQIEEARASANQDRALLTRPSRRALRVRGK